MSRVRPRASDLKRITENVYRIVTMSYDRRRGQAANPKGASRDVGDQARAGGKGLRRRRPSRRRRHLHDRKRRVHGARRPLRLRQVDAPADDRRPRGGHRGPDLDRRPRGLPARAARSGHRDGLPELRALPAHDRGQEPRLRPQGARDAEGGDRTAGRRGRDDARARGSARPEARRPLRRSATAGRDGARDRQGAGRLPDGRAALQPRRQAPRRHARRARAPARAARDHDRLRHARPGGGDDARDARRGDARRNGAAGRHARRRSTGSRRTSSSRRSSALRR